MGPICEEQAVFLTYQEHIVTTSASYSNAGESDPSECTFPGCGQIRTKARCVRCYKWRGGKMTEHKIPTELATATAEKPPPTVAHTSLKHEADDETTLSTSSGRSQTSRQPHVNIPC